jgi:hypothetical protein
MTARRQALSYVASSFPQSFPIKPAAVIMPGMILSNVFRIPGTLSQKQMVSKKTPWKHIALTKGLKSAAYAVSSFAGVISQILGLLWATIATKTLRFFSH